MTNESRSTSLDLLVSGVLALIREYDRSGDHLPHATDADCIRCKLLTTVASQAIDHDNARIECLCAAVFAVDKVVFVRIVSIPDHVVALLRERASGFVVRADRKPDDDDIKRRDKSARALIDAWSEGVRYLYLPLAEGGAR
jgi:hypothetical protein